MAARHTGLSVSAYTLVGADYLGDLQVFGLDVGATTAETHGIAATNVRTQITKRSATHRFELLINNSGPKLTNLNVTVWNPLGTSLLGSLKEGSISVSIPTGDGSGIADVFEFANVVGARRWTVTSNHLILASSTTFAPFTAARSTTVTDWNAPTLQVTLGTGQVYNLNTVLAEVSHTVERDGLQTARCVFQGAGTHTSVPTGSTIFGAAMSGSGLAVLYGNTGPGEWDGTGVITSLEIAFADGQATRVSGELMIQGQPSYS